MATDEEKYRLVKLLQEVEVPEVKLSERCSGLVRELHEKYSPDMENHILNTENFENPYIPDKILLEENEKKLKDLLADNKRDKLKICEDVTTADPKRPWRTNSNKEKLLRVDSELKQHKDAASQLIAPMEEDKMKDLIKECREEARAAHPVGSNRLKETVEEARKNLPNFQYRNIQNSTATAILPIAQAMISTAPTVVKVEP